MAGSPIHPVLVCVGASILMSLAPQARASDIYTVNIVQSGSNVVATGSGSLSVSGSTETGLIAFDGVQADESYLILGGGENEVYGGVTGPSNFGTGGQFTVSSSTGGEIGIALDFDVYVVPFGYVAGTSLPSTATWDSATLASLGLTVGTYTYTLGDGDSFVINVGSTTPEPASLLLTGAGLLGLMAGLRKRKAQGLAQTT